MDVFRKIMKCGKIVIFLQKIATLPAATAKLDTALTSVSVLLSKISLEFFHSRNNARQWII